MADLILYGNMDITRTWKVAWMCRELGIEFQNDRPEHFLDPSWKSPEYLAINPSGLVPSIMDGEFVLWETMAINLYLAKKYGRGRLYPETLASEALAWQWSFWATTRLEVPFLVVGVSNAKHAPGSELERYFLKHAPMWTPDEVARSRAVLNGPLCVLNDKLAASPYLYKSALDLSDSARCNGRRAAIIMVRRCAADLKPGVCDTPLRGCGA
jgi:glutathione S-transferase